MGCFEKLGIYAKRDELPVLREAINEVQCGVIVYHGTDKICEKPVNVVRASMLDVFSRLPPMFPIVLLACGQKAPAEEFILHLSKVSTKAREAVLPFNYAIDIGINYRVKRRRVEEEELPKESLIAFVEFDSGEDVEVPLVSTMWGNRTFSIMTASGTRFDLGGRGEPIVSL